VVEAISLIGPRRGYRARRDDQGECESQST
jgi:hypothetical protein